MKRLFIIICALFVGFAYAENETVVTSKKFVDDALAQKQPKFDGLGNDKLMLYSNTTDGVVASRDIVTTLGNSTSANTIPTVGAINAGLNTKQDTLNGDAGWVAENTGIAGAVVQKPVYSATNNYSNALVEVETLNNAVINAVNSELTVVPGVGWTINTAANLNLLPMPQTYNDVPPGGYTRLEYIESTGFEQIDTGISGLNSGDWTIYTKWMLTGEPKEDWGRVISAYSSDAQNTYRIILMQKSLTGYLFNGNSRGGNGGVSKRLYANQIHEGTITNGYVIVDGSKVETRYQGTDISANSPIIVFGNGFVGRQYHSYIQHNDATVANLVPARRNSDNEIGLYDTVRNIFLTNTTGTGTFTAGPDVNY